MCEFCTAHGEGKKWYLQMKNYAQELLHQELSSTQKEIVNASTRLEWNQRFFESFVMPAMGLSAPPSRSSPGRSMPRRQTSGLSRSRRQGTNRGAKLV